MKNSVKSIFAMILTVVIISVIGINTFAEAPVDGAELTAAAEAESSESAVTSAKAWAAAIIIAIASGAGAISMGMAISKSAEGIARQPEASGQIRTGMMLGLVFIETAIIYSLIIAILVIFVL